MHSLITHSHTPDAAQLLPAPPQQAPLLGGQARLPVCRKECQAEVGQALDHRQTGVQDMARTWPGGGALAADWHSAGIAPFAFPSWTWTVNNVAFTGTTTA